MIYIINKKNDFFYYIYIIKKNNDLMKHLKLFEEISEELRKRALNQAIDRKQAAVAAGDSLKARKFNQQQDTFSSYSNSEIKKKLFDLGFGFYENNKITYSIGRIDKNPWEAQYIVYVKPDSYKITKGDDIPEDVVRKFLRAVQIVQDYLKGGKKIESEA